MDDLALGLVEVVSHDVESEVLVLVNRQYTDIGNRYESKVQVKALCSRFSNQAHVDMAFFTGLNARSDETGTGPSRLILWMCTEKLKVTLICTKIIVNVFAFLSCEFMIEIECSCQV